MAREPVVYVYVARTPTDQRVLAIGPEECDPAEHKLYWHALDAEQDHTELLESLGYRLLDARGKDTTVLKAHPGYWNHVGEKRVKLRYGKVQCRDGVPLIDAIDAAIAAGLMAADTPKAERSKRANSFRVYARRGHGPKPYDNLKKPLWVESEVKWWAAKRTGQGQRTDKTAPLITANDA